MRVSSWNQCGQTRRSYLGQIIVSGAQATNKAKSLMSSSNYFWIDYWIVYAVVVLFVALLALQILCLQRIGQQADGTRMAT